MFSVVTISNESPHNGRIAKRYAACSKLSGLGFNPKPVIKHHLGVSQAG